MPLCCNVCWPCAGRWWRPDQCRPIALFNPTLPELARRLPPDETALSQIHGIAKGEARKYGHILLEEIRNHLAAGRREEEQP
ncbi:MAG: HRDC domain-containing protein [Halieaceae bacterium]|nr:HRDC domain-containing protein [Halieaceae bacterium]